jgi:hypothetical protein
MQRLITIYVLMLIIIPSFLIAADKDSPYKGQEDRLIKALSPEEIDGYLHGKGMGMAKAAELNHYPGPLHVLDLAEELHLSEEQLLKTREAYNNMHKKAVSLGKFIIEKEKTLNSLFENQEIDEPRLKELVVDLGALKGKLRASHLAAHLEMKTILSPEQVERYDMLRGYLHEGGEGSGHYDHKHMHH